MINTEIIEAYVKRKDFSEHWLFYNLVEGEYLFEYPTLDREKLLSFYELFVKELEKFEPKELAFFKKFFRHWKSDIDSDLEVLIAVGCPKPYDAMIREWRGRSVVIFDINQLYTEKIEDVIPLFQTLITHELFHVLYAKYHGQEQEEFKDKLLQLCFSEGFAYYLGLGDELLKNLDEVTERHYKQNLDRFLVALEEKDSERQEEILLECKENEFFENYCAVTGFLVVCHNKEKINELFKAGPQKFLEYRI